MRQIDKASNQDGRTEDAVLDQPEKQQNQME